MKNLILFFIFSLSVAKAQILPIDNSEYLVEDELFSYQWGLLNQGQTLIREKDDIHNLPQIGIVKKDIGWRDLVGKFPERRPIVAVLDSGVDITHPELAGNLWTNKEECGKDPTKDNDGNRLAGDCNGWNFTEDINSDEAKDPSDIDGHGTHISGIIAALNNGFGMVGVHPNALIMPIKVMKDSNSKSEVPSSEAFARGIIYAVDNGADVINMSLGWPRSLETKTLRDAVYYALGQNVPIVAAAGNNNSSEPLFPCAYDGVICVGSTSIDGRFAGFSNFGGHVDTLAPGESILGLNPILLEPEYFSVNGFEMRSGTSQSAPFVSGLIAALKAKNKDTTIDQIFAKLYQAQSVKDSRKYILGGEATWESLNAPITTPVIRPIFKKVRQIVFRGEGPNSKLGVTIRNFGIPSGSISVKIESLSKALDFSSEAQVIPNLAQGEFKDLVFDLKAVNLDSESNVGIKVSIENNGSTASYTNEIPVIRDIRGEDKFKKTTFAFKDKVLPVGVSRGSDVIPLISTLESYTKSSAHDFFMKKTLKEEKKIELTIFSKKNGHFVQAPNQVIIENSQTLVNFVRADLNFDGVEDYLVQSIGEKDGKKYFIFSYFDNNFLPLFSKFQNIDLKLDLFLESLNDLHLMKIDHPNLGKIMVPAFFTTGMLPKLDQSITSFEKYDLTRKKRLYYLELNNSNEFIVRSLTTNIWENEVKKELKLKWFETVESEQVLPVSDIDARNGQLRILVSAGLGTKRQLFIYTFDSRTKVHGPKIPQLVLQSDSVDPLLFVTSTGLSNAGDMFFNIYDRTRSKLVSTRQDSQLREFIFRHESESDLIAGHIASFETDHGHFSVFQTREELISISNNDASKRSSRSKLRYSFLSQKLLSEMYFPVAYKRNEILKPALYVDATSVTGNRVYLFEEQKGVLVSSIRNSLVVPTGCRSLNPKFSTTAGTYEFIFLCQEEKDFVIRSYPMN